MEVKVWIKSNQINKSVPDKYWTSRPLQENDVIELMVDVETFNRWVHGTKKENVQNFGKKQILND